MIVLWSPGGVVDVAGGREGWWAAWYLGRAVLAGAPGPVVGVRGVVRFDPARREISSTPAGSTLAQFAPQQFRQGTDAAVALSERGVLPSVLAATRLVVTWEAADPALTLTLPGAFLPNRHGRAGRLAERPTRWAGTRSACTFGPSRRPGYPP